MREFKTTFWVILLFLLAVFIYQNQHFFFQSNQSFRINLIFTEYKSPEIPSSLIFISCIFIGFFIAYGLSIPGRMTSRKKIKLLQKAVDSQLKEISSLNNKLNDLNARHMKPVSENTEKSHSDYR